MVSRSDVRYIQSENWPACALRVPTRLIKHPCMSFASFCFFVCFFCFVLIIHGQTNKSLCRCWGQRKGPRKYTRLSSQVIVSALCRPEPDSCVTTTTYSYFNHSRPDYFSSIATSLAPPCGYCCRGGEGGGDTIRQPPHCHQLLAFPWLLSYVHK